MPATLEQRSRLLVARKHVKRAKGLTRGVDAELERHCMKTARVLLRQCSADDLLHIGEFDQMPAWVNDEAVSLAWTGATFEAEVPAPVPVVVGDAPPPVISDPAEAEPHQTPDSARVKSHAADIYISEHKDALRVKARTLKDTTKLYADTPLHKVMRIVGWRRWKRMSQDEQAPYIGKARGGRSRGRSANGQFAAQRESPPDSMEHLLLDDVVPTPSKGLKKQGDKAKLGNAFVDVMEEIIESPAKDGHRQHMKNVAKQMFRTVVKKSGLKRSLANRLAAFKRISKYDWKFGPSISQQRLKPGRKKGYRRISDANLKEALSEHTQPGCKWSFKNNTTFDTLTGSLRSVHHGSSDIRSVISYRQLCRRFSAGKLGVSKGSKRVDVCEQCHHFDTQFAPHMESMLKGFITAMAQVCPEFLREWGERVQAHPVWGTSEFVRGASPSYVDGLIQYIDAKAEDHDFEVCALAHGVMEDLRKELPKLEGYSTHFAVRDHQHQAWLDSVENPQPQTLYLQWDQQECLGQI